MIERTCNVSLDIVMINHTQSHETADQRSIVALGLARAPRLSFSLNTIIKLYLGHLSDRAARRRTNVMSCHICVRLAQLLIHKSTKEAR